jgi:hypothetical protein
MSAAVGQAQPVAPAPEAAATPFEQASVTLSRQVHVQLVMQAHSWKSMYQRAVARTEQQRQQYSQAIERIKALERLVQEYERVRLREAELREQLIYSLEQARRRELRLRAQHVCDREKVKHQEAALREQLAQEPSLQS